MNDDLYLFLFHFKKITFFYWIKFIDLNKHATKINKRPMGHIAYLRKSYKYCLYKRFGILLWHFWLSHWLTCPFQQAVSVPNIVPLVNRTYLLWHSRLQMEYLPRIAAKHDSETRNCFSSSSVYLSLHFLSVVLLNFDKEVEISVSVHPGKVLLLWRSLWSWGSGVVIINSGAETSALAQCAFLL